MPTAATLIAGVADLRGAPLRDRLVEARRAAKSENADAAIIAAVDASIVAAMQDGIRALAAALPPAPRTLADLPAAVATGAARNAARPPAPMRRIPPVPPRAADATVSDARPAAAAPTVPVADAAAAAPDAGGAHGAATVLPPAPAPRPALAPGRLANLKRPAVEPEPEAAEVEQTLRNPMLPPGPGPQPKYDPEKLAWHKRRYGKASWPYLRPDGTYSYDAPALDPADDLIPF